MRLILNKYLFFLLYVVFNIFLINIESIALTKDPIEAVLIDGLPKTIDVQKVKEYIRHNYLNGGVEPGLRSFIPDTKGEDIRILIKIIENGSPSWVTLIYNTNSPVMKTFKDKIAASKGSLDKYKPISCVDLYGLDTIYGIDKFSVLKANSGIDLELADTGIKDLVIANDSDKFIVTLKNPDYENDQYFNVLITKTGNKNISKYVTICFIGKTNKGLIAEELRSLTGTPTLTEIGKVDDIGFYIEDKYRVNKANKLVLYECIFNFIK